LSIRLIISVPVELATEEFRSTVCYLELGRAILFASEKLLTLETDLAFMFSAGFY